MTLTERVTDGLRAIPPILGCTAGAYLLDFSGCVSKVAETLPADGLNLGYHLAAGSGLYGGYTSKENRKRLAVLYQGKLGKEKQFLYMPITYEDISNIGKYVTNK